MLLDLLANPRESALVDCLADGGSGAVKFSRQIGNTSAVFKQLGFDGQPKFSLFASVHSVNTLSVNDR